MRKKKVNHVSEKKKKSRSTSPNIFTTIISLSYVISDTIKLLLWKRVRAMKIITVRKSINIYWHARTHVYTLVTLPNAVYVAHSSVELSTTISEFARKYTITQIHWYLFTIIMLPHIRCFAIVNTRFFHFSSIMSLYVCHIYIYP